MRSLSESATSILLTVTEARDAPLTPAHGSTQQEIGDGQTNTKSKALTIPPARNYPLTVENLRTTGSVIASMQQQGRLTISSVNREGRSPIRDYDGNIVSWEFNLVPTGDFTLKVSDPTQEERMALETAITPGHRTGIHVLLERLAQIKPIGASEAKQATVLSYLTYDLVQDGVSEFVVSELCAEQRKKPVYEESDRFFPDMGDFLLSARWRMNHYKAALQAVIDKQGQENKK